MEIPNAEARALDLLQPGCAQVYEAQLNRIWWVLIPTRESMHIVKSIVNFPLQKFVDPREIGFFWSVLVRNCGNAVVLNLHSLVNDNETGTLSLKRWANSVCQWIKPQYLDWYKQRLRDAKFDSRLRKIQERVRDMRHHIAHIFVSHNGMPAATTRGISEEESESLYSATEELFRVACLTAEYVIDERKYHVGTASPRSMEKLLDLVAKDSYWLNQPEIRKEWWQMEREYMSKGELAKLNEWRARYGRPPA